jgi:hypothetical protein
MLRAKRAGRTLGTETSPQEPTVPFGAAAVGEGQGVADLDIALSDSSIDSRSLQEEFPAADSHYAPASLDQDTSYQMWDTTPVFVPRRASMDLRVHATDYEMERTTMWPKEASTPGVFVTQRPRSF